MLILKYPDAHPTEQYPPSAQVTAGLKAWSEGRIPTTLVQLWCLQSVIDPPDHTKVAELACLGFCGSVPGHINTDLLLVLRKQLRTTCQYLPRLAAL
jgi:hypothetical protein